MRILIAWFVSLSLALANPLLILSGRPPAAGTTLNNNIVAFWDLDEASGTRADSVGSITLTDNASVLGATGKISNGADFEFSSSQYLSAADPAAVDFNGSQDFTIAFWLKYETHTASNFIVCKYNSTGNQRQYGVLYDSTADRLRFLVNELGTSAADVFVNADALGAPSNATWYFIVAWHDGAADTINISVNDGTTNSAAHSVGLFNSTAALTMGARAGPGDRLDGIVDEVGMWNRVLTSGERTELYNSGNGKTYPF